MASSNMSGPSSGGISLKSCQLASIDRMLNFNANKDEAKRKSVDDMLNPVNGSSSSTGHQWKVLIYDQTCRSIISPLLSVSQLRSRGVTLHLMISSEREPIPDVPAIYFVEPSRSNLQIIASDCAKGLYGTVYLNFVTKLERPLMEEFAKLIVQSNSLSNIASIHDLYLDYICLERNLFSLNKQDSYFSINNSGVTEQVMEKYLEEIAYGVFSVIGTLGCAPIIRCPKGGAPEMVARKLNRLVTDHPTLSRGKSLQHRPLLVILDRNMDLITPVQHTSTYQALIDDTLKHKGNRVEFSVTVENERRRWPQTVQKKFDLDPDEDPFYSNHKFNAFPEAIESNGAELQEVTARENEIRSKATGGESDSKVVKSDPMGGSATTDLTNAVDSLPVLLERKKQLETHTSILQAVMNEVASRDVPQFYELESSLAIGQYKNDLAKAKNEVLSLVTDPSKGNVEDKIRLVLVFTLATSASSSDITEVANNMAESLETKGLVAGKSDPNSAEENKRAPLTKDDRIKVEKGMRAIEYLKNLRSMQMIPTMTNASSMQTYSQSSSNNSDLLSNLMSRASNQATGLLAKATDRVTSMLGKTHKHLATRVIESLCEMKPNTEDDEYLYLDPKVKGDVDVKKLRTMARVPVKEVICFVVGGGCYAEYQNLQMLANESRTISYGSTELASPGDFLSQLGKL